MTSPDDDLAEIAASGTLEPRGQAALLRLQARAGAYRVLPSPDEILLLKAAHADAARACLLCGQVRSAGMLCDLLSFVGHSGWRGQFVVKSDASTRSIFFDGGHVTGAESTVVRERLGEVLYGYGVLTREQVNACGEATADGRLRFGEAAVKHGYLTRERLFGLMERQIEEIFYGLLLVADGTFFFLEGYEEEHLASRHTLSLTSLVREGIRRMHEMRYFRAKIPSEQHVPARVADRAPPNPDPGGVYSVTDGMLTVADLCRALGIGEFEVTRSLFHLVQTGHLVINAPRVTPTAVVDVYNRAASLLLRELDAMDEGDGVRDQLATFAAKEPYARILAGAGPADDGTLDAARLEQNLASQGAPPNAEENLATWLHELASYALFLARPHLRRKATKQAVRDGDNTRVSMRVSAMLDAIGPATDRPGPPDGPKDP